MLPLPPTERRAKSKSGFDKTKPDKKKVNKKTATGLKTKGAHAGVVVVLVVEQGVVVNVAII